MIKSKHNSELVAVGGQNGSRVTKLKRWHCELIGIEVQKYIRASYEMYQGHWEWPNKPKGLKYTYIILRTIVNKYTTITVYLHQN